MIALFLELKLYAKLLMRSRSLKSCVIMWKNIRIFMKRARWLRASNYYIKPAGGETLDKFGLLYGLERFPSESDDLYRERLRKVAQGLGRSK